MFGPVVPFHEFVAKAWAASCFSESLGESLCDSFTVDSEAAGFGGWNERDDFGWFRVVVEVVSGKGVDVYVHLSRPW